VTTGQSGYEIVGRFLYPHEAEVARTVLESAGIPPGSSTATDIPEPALPPSPRGALSGLRRRLGPGGAQASPRVVPEWLQALVFFGLGAVAIGRSFRVDRACRACGHRGSVT
jgi:hypothetical protein